jgi:PBSX family phage terminase large subunit
MKVQFEVHESHIPLWERNDWRYTILMGGRGNGRSGTASRYAISQLFSKEYTRGAIMRATREDIRASCWGEINDRLTEQNIANQFRIVDNDMFIERGQNSIRAHGFRASSGSLTARLKSLAGYNFIWAEEAEEIGEEEFRTLDDTLRTVKGRIRIILTLNTPAKGHWILNKWFDLVPSEVSGFFIPKLKENMKDVLFIPGTWRENEVNLDRKTIEHYQAYKNVNPAWYWQIIEGLSPEEVRGKIYTGWQLIDGIPQDARLVKIGVDWGWYPDSLSVIALYYYNGGYIVDEVIYGTNITDEALASAIKKVNGWQQVTAVCGADEPKSIDTLKSFRINAERSVSGAGSVEYRIKATSAKKMFVTRRSTNVWNSYENYHWAEDKDGNPKGEPNHFMSDCMDAVSYAVSSISPLNEYIRPNNTTPKAKSNIAV